MPFCRERGKSPISLKNLLILMTGRTPDNPSGTHPRSRTLTQGCRGWIFAVVVVGAVFTSLLNAGIRWVGMSGGTGVWLGTGLEFVALPLVYLGQRRRQEGYTATELAAALELEV